MSLDRFKKRTNFKGKFCYWIFVTQQSEEPMNEKLFEELPINVMKYQRERCPTTGNLHWQGYIEWSEPKSYAYCRSKFPWWFQDCVNRFACQVYCRKGWTQVTKPVVWRRLSGMRVEPDVGSTAFPGSLSARVKPARLGRSSVTTLAPEPWYCPDMFCTGHSSPPANYNIRLI